MNAAGLRATRDCRHGLLACRHRQRGVAVLTAMLVVTVGTILAVNLMWQAQLDQRRTAAALAADQGLMYTHGAEAWAADILRQDLVDSPFSDNLSELWATEIPPLPVEGGVVSARLEDLQGRFNLNNLVDESGEEDALALRQFERLLTLVGLEPSLAGAIVDWLDPNADPRFPDGAEDAAYGNTNPQYRTANVMITSPSELMAVTGFDAEGLCVGRALRYRAANRNETKRQYGFGSPPGYAVGRAGFAYGRLACRGTRRRRVRGHRDRVC